MTVKTDGLSLAEITALGQKADPVILRALSHDSMSDFLPCLRYHFRVGGKRMRAAMVILSCMAAGGKMASSILPAAAVEMIHNYSLVIDDIIDKGDMRRGLPTVRRKFGEATSILVAMSYRETLDEIVQACDHRDVIRRISIHAMKEIIDGERLDLQFEQAGRDDPFLQENRFAKPDFQNYLQMIGKKTASLFEAAGMVGAYSAGANPKVVRKLANYGWKAGLAFQIMDDVLDIFGRGTGKQRAKDIIDHKLGNAAVLVAIKYLTRRESDELRSILRLRPVSHEQAMRAIELIEKTPSQVECRQVAERYLVDAKQNLDFLPDSKYTASLLELADRIASRDF